MMQPETTSLAQSAGTVLASHWELIATALLVLALLAWAWVRAGSSHIIMSRVWHFLFGKPDVKSDLMSTYLEERDTLMRFRVMTGLQLKSAQTAERLVLWTRRHDVDMDLVRGAGLYFDPDKPGMRRNPPEKWIVRIALLCCVASSAVATYATALGLTTPPLIHVLKSGNWYAVDFEKTQRFRGRLNPDEPGFPVTKCPDPTDVVKTTGFEANDVSVLCDVMATSAGEKLMKEGLRAQYGLTLVAFSAFMGIALTLLRAVSRAGNAQKLYDLVTPKTEPESVLPSIMPNEDEA